MDVEKAMLAIFLTIPKSLDEVSSWVTVDMFYKPEHQAIYAAMRSLHQDNRAIDIVTVSEALKTKQELDFIGGPYYLAELTKNIMYNQELSDYADILRGYFIKREMITTGAQLLTVGYDDTVAPDEALELFDQKLFAMTKDERVAEFVDLPSLVAQAVMRTEHLMTNKQDITGVPTGFPALDSVTFGWQQTDLIILAARPSVGKTAFALNLARNAAVRGVPSAFFSLEMSALQLTNRLIAAEGEIDMEHIAHGRFASTQEHLHFIETAKAVSLLKLYFDDTPALSIFDFKRKARKLVAKHKVGLIVIDYLQLMSGKTNDVFQREQEISLISRTLKATAKELNVPIIALSQLTRALEKEKREPQLSDLRESGAIEQDADMVAFLTRADYQKEGNNVDPTLRNNADMFIRKHRNGKLEKLSFKTDLSIQKWFDIADWYSREKFKVTNEPEEHFHDFSLEDETLPF